MQRIDGGYLYTLGAQVHPLVEITEKTTMAEAFLPILTAYGAVDTLLTRSIYRPITSYAAGQSLLQNLQWLREQIEKEPDQDRPLKPYWLYLLRDVVGKFETVFQAELTVTDTYLVTRVRGYQMSSLIDYGWVVFPDDLAAKVSECIADVAQGTRCIAFGLATAAAFHLHRANEAVLRKYFEALAPGAAIPGRGAMGDYINALSQLGLGDPRVMAALRDLKDLHRNPVAHPEQSLESVDDAVALLGQINTTIVYMLKAIPMPTPPVATTPAAAAAS